MSGLLQNLLNPIEDPLQLVLPNMWAAERTIATRILRTIRAHPKNPLLLEATLLFVNAASGDDEAVLAAARDLENLAEEDVLVKPGLHIQAYAEARARFDNTHASGTLSNKIFYLMSTVCTSSHNPIRIN